MIITVKRLDFCENFMSTETCTECVIKLYWRPQRLGRLRGAIQLVANHLSSLRVDSESSDQTKFMSADHKTQIV